MHTAVRKKCRKVGFFSSYFYKAGKRNLLIFFCQIWKGLVLWKALVIKQQAMKAMNSVDTWN